MPSTPDPDPEDLARRAAAGDRAALEALWGQHADRIHAAVPPDRLPRRGRPQRRQEAMMAVASRSRRCSVQLPPRSTVVGAAGRGMIDPNDCSGLSNWKLVT